jgi:Flp pilus assembly protein TadD
MQPLPESTIRLWYQKPKVWITIGVIACLAFLAMPHARRIYHRWTGERKVQRAKQALERREFDAAILNARGALATNVKDVEAIRIMAKTAEATGAATAAISFRRQLDAIKPGDSENILGLAESCLKVGDPGAAEEAVKSLAEADRDSAHYYGVTSAIAWARGDMVKAELQAAEAARRDPSNDSYRFRLATLRLNAASSDLRSQAVATFEELSGKPTMRSAALRTLLGNALQRGDKDRAKEIADAIAATPGATFADKLAQLSALNALRQPEPGSVTRVRVVQDSEFFEMLARFQELAAGKAEDTFALASWMNEHHLALMASDWLNKLPADVRSKPPVSVAVADAYALGSDWNKLKESIESATWQHLEFLRFAFLAQALERLGDAGGCAVAWNNALQEAQDHPAAREQLARHAINWGWKQRAEELLWKLAEADPCPRWVADSLWESAAKRRDAEALCKISKIILAAEPKSVAARSSYVSFLLLTEQEPEVSRSMAEALYKENPANAEIAASYAYSLYQQARPWEAVSVLRTFREEELRQPWLAFQYSIVLAAAGEFEQAEEYLRLSSPFEKFSQQQPLADFLLAAFDTRAAALQNDPAGAAGNWKRAISAAKTSPAWLETLGQMALKWGWRERVEEVVVKLAEAERCPSWAADILWTTALQSGDASWLYKSAKLIMTSNPKSLSARSTFATVALLARNEADSPHSLAEALAEGNPGNSEAAATYGFSLYRQGRIDQAMAVLRKLAPDQLREPRTAFYYAIVLAASGQTEQAEEYLAIGVTRPLLPEESAMSDVLQKAFQARTLIKRGDTGAGRDAWNQALSSAENRPDLLESLARMAAKWDASERAEEALWRLSDRGDCPRWVLDSLWTAAEKRRDSRQLYKVSRLLRKSDPNNLAARNNFVRLSLLTGQDADFPHRQAQTLSNENPGNADVAVTYALSLYERGKSKDAVAVLAALRPEQLRAPKSAFYFGIFLASSGESEKAREYLDLGTKASLLPEEQALLAKVTQPR